jgi:hypothetical protein
MEPTRKVTVSIVVKRITDTQEHRAANRASNQYMELQSVKNILNSISETNKEEDLSKVLRILSAAKHSNEVMATALIDADREDLFDEKVETIHTIDDIIKFINTL